MTNSRKESKAPFFDHLYSVYDGSLDEDEDDCASVGFSLGFRPHTLPNQDRKDSINTSPVENTGPVKPLPVPNDAESISAAQPMVYHQQKLPDSLRFKFVGVKASKSSGKTKARRSLAREPALFTGMYFYFIPNNLKHPARKLRVQRAHEHGAFCVSGSFSGCEQAVTHIIVDSSFKYKDVVKALSIGCIPDHIILVKDNYPSDCLRYLRIVDHTQLIYAVPSQVKPATPAELSVESPPRSLQIKGRAADIVHETPRRNHSVQASSNIPSNSSPPSSSISEERDCSDAELGTSGLQLQQKFKYNDDLETMIGESKKMPFLDNEDHPSDDAGEGNDSGDETREGPRKKLRKIYKGTRVGFQCMNKNDGSANEKNPNARTIQVLAEMEQYYARSKDEWRSISYRKAIATLRKQSRKICFADEAIELPNVGSRIAKKIEEIVQTDSLKRLQYAKLEPNDAPLKLFLGIYGVGLSHAQKWVAAGHKTLQDLLDNEKLADSQRIGIERHADFATRIPRDEVQKHGEVVIQAAKEIDAELKLDIMGSFRRGASDCGDIDVMITKVDAESRQMRAVLDKLVNKLTAAGFLRCSLAIPRGCDDGSKWHGASQLSPSLPWRRIDFLIVPWVERGAALLYFTGNDIFNRSMRLLASKKGFRLNQRGLYKDVIRGAQRQKINEGTLVEGESEEKIFEILGIPSRPPQDRNC